MVVLRLYISRLLERLPRTSQMTVAFCRTLIVAHCASTPMTRGSCSCREHNKLGDRSFLAAGPRLWTVERSSTWTPAAEKLLSPILLCSRHKQLPHVTGIGPQWATTNVRQKATVVCRVRGSRSNERLMYEPLDLEHNALKLLFSHMCLCHQAA